MAGDWWTAAELLALGSVELPRTVQNINARAKREGWARRREGGANHAWAYAAHSLPPALRQIIAERSVAARPVTLDLFDQPAASAAPRQKTAANLAALTGHRQARAENRLAVLAAFDTYRHAAGIAEICRAARLFAAAWNAGRIEADPALLAAMPKLARNSLLNWQAAREQRGAASLAGAWRGRREAGEIESQPAIRDLLLAIYAEKPHLTAGHFRDALRNNLPANLALPKTHTINRFLRRWRDENERLNMKLRDPDRAKSKYGPAIGNAAAGIERTNQVWQLDASPADVMCRDGRHKLTVVIDVATRRALVLVTDQPKAIAHLALFRAFALRLGLPELVKTDNGQDYRAKSFTTAMAALHVRQEFCPPYSPERKPFIERFIGTLQRDLLATLPGFTGHNVAQAQQLRARKRFAERLGQHDDDVFGVDLTAAELQGAILAWLDRYHDTPHGGLGCSPNERAAQLGAGRLGIPDQAAMDVCLMPLATRGGLRSVLHDGIHSEGTVFIAPWVGARTGSKVLVRLDPMDMGVIYCFDPASHQRIGIAVDPARAGISQQAMAAEAHALQKTVDQPFMEMQRKLRRSLKPHRLADARASGQPVLPESVEISLGGAKHAGLQHLENLNKRALLPPPEEAAPQPVVAPAAPAADAVPAREADFVAWVLAGNGTAHHRRWLASKARASEAFCEAYEISAAQLAALEQAAARAA